MRSRRCRDLGGAIVCGASATAGDREQLAMFKRYLRGELTGPALRAYTGLDGAEPADLGQVARLMEIAKGEGTAAQARDASGLSVGQAVRLLGWERARLEAIEAGATMSTAERSALCVLYEVSGFVGGGAPAPAVAYEERPLDSAAELDELLRLRAELSYADWKAHPRFRKERVLREAQRRWGAPADEALFWPELLPAVDVPHDPDGAAKEDADTLGDDEVPHE